MRSPKSYLVLLLLALCCTAQAQTTWDQEAARQKVQAVLDLEQQGRPWNDIPWLTSIKAAEYAAKQKNKPIFLFLYIKKPVGPKDAQC